MRTLIVIIIVWLAAAVMFATSELPIVTQAPTWSDRLWAAGKHIVLLEWLDKWQTLAGGLLTIAGALIGGRYIMRQINEDKLFEQDRIDRHSRAARAVLPLSLSAIAGYALASTRILASMYRRQNNDVVQWLNDYPPFPKVPASIITEMKELINCSPTAIGAVATEILSSIQVQSSRLESLSSELIAEAGHLPQISKNIFMILQKYMQLHQACLSTHVVKRKMLRERSMGRLSCLP